MKNLVPGLGRRPRGRGGNAAPRPAVSKGGESKPSGDDPPISLSAGFPRLPRLSRLAARLPASIPPCVSRKSKPCGSSSSLALIPRATFDYALALHIVEDISAKALTIPYLFLTPCLPVQPPVRQPAFGREAGRVGRAVEKGVLRLLSATSAFAFALELSTITAFEHAARPPSALLRR